MATQAINVDLPDEIYRRLQSMADATRQPLEAVPGQTPRGNLPLTWDDLPPAQRGLMATLASLGDAALLMVAREPLPARDGRRHGHLPRKAGCGTLSPAEADRKSVVEG